MRLCEAPVMLLCCQVIFQNGLATYRPACIPKLRDDAERRDVFSFLVLPA
jgi:hypothetical protein